MCSDGATPPTVKNTKLDLALKDQLTNESTSWPANSNGSNIPMQIFESVVFFVAGLGGGFDSSICVPVQYVTPSIYGLFDQKKLQDMTQQGRGLAEAPGFQSIAAVP